MATREEEEESSYEEYSEEYEEEEEEEEEEEPKLKYHRLGFSVVDILKEDSACCMAVNDKFLVGSFSILIFLYVTYFLFFFYFLIKRLWVLEEEGFIFWILMVTKINLLIIMKVLLVNLVLMIVVNLLLVLV